MHLRTALNPRRSGSLWLLTWVAWATLVLGSAMAAGLPQAAMAASTDMDAGGATCHTMPMPAHCHGGPMGASIPGPDHAGCPDGPCHCLSACAALLWLPVTRLAADWGSAALPAQRVRRWLPVVRARQLRPPIV